MNLYKVTAFNVSEILVLGGIASGFKPLCIPRRVESDVTAYPVASRAAVPVSAATVFVGKK